MANRPSSGPRVAEDPREGPGEVAEPPGKVWFRDLDEAVIEADRCIQCGSCVAACPSDSIGIDEDEGRPTLVRMCTGCSSCWDYCPRSGLRYERVVDMVREQRGLEERELYAVRADSDAGEVGQDGGVVTEILARLVEDGDLDGAIVACEDPSEPLAGEATLVTSRAELLEAAGSIYNQVMSLGRIDDLVADAGLSDPDLALVGTPCVIQGAAALERYDHGAASPIALTIALMCTRSFEADRLAGLLVERGVDPVNVSKLDVTEGTLLAYDAADECLLAADVDAFGSAGLWGCDECGDFVGGAADISAGSVASPDGYTTIIVRTPRGKRAFDGVASGLDRTTLDDAATLGGIVDWNRRRATQVLPREFDPDGSVGIGVDDHRETYADTDRDPEALNPARVHQYEEWC